MSIIQAVIGSIVSSGSATPTPTYTLTPTTNNVDEGASLTFTVGGTNIPNGTYYWNTDTGDLVGFAGDVTVTNNSGSFSVTPTADVTTEGAETFTATLRLGSVDGTILATSSSVTINDTSQTPVPVPPFSLEFVENQGDYLEAAGSSDWNLGTTWTIEFWLNADAASATANGGIWGLLNQGGWSTTNNIVVALSDNKLVYLSRAWNANDDVRYVEPTPGVWTHVAIANDAGTQKVFYNGSEQARVSGNVGSAEYTNGSTPLRIGRLGPANGGTLNGKMALVRISNTAKYSTTFTPTITYGVEADTKLFLGTNNPLVDTSIYELNGVALTNGNGANLYIPKSTYPNLNNQVRAGDTVVNADNLSSSSVVSGAVYTADPDNWGVPISPSMTSVGTVNFSGPGRHSITNNGVALSNDVPTTFAPQSLQFVQAQTDYLDVAASNDWNLGATWTIEYWSKAAKGSTESDLLTVMCQNYTTGSGIQILNIGGSLQIQGNTRIAAEPLVGGTPTSVSNWNGGGGWNSPPYTNLATTGGTGTGLTVDVSTASGGYTNINAITIHTPGRGYTNGDVITINNENNLPGTFTISVAAPTWTHVALVSDGTDLKLYYNGVSQYTGSAWNLNNTTDPIRIGARGLAEFQRFDGLLALIRISNTAKYTAAFTPSNNYGVEADTKLFLGEKVPLIDAKGHAITNHGVTTSTGYPPMSYTLTVLAYDFNHGYATNYGSNQIWVLIADYPDIVNVPNGATIVVSGQNSGTYTASGVQTMSGKRLLISGIGGSVNGSDTLTITWTA